MSRSLIGSITVGPTDKDIVVGPIEIPPREGIEIWVKQTSPLSSPWWYSYGLLWAENDHGRYAGTIKIFGHPEGEAYRLGAGLFAPVGAGMLKFSPRLWNLRWLQSSGETWSLDFWADQSSQM